MNPTVAFESSGALSKEPVAILATAAIVIVDAGIALAAAFDWADLTPAQTTAILAFVTVVSGTVSALLRQQVYSPATYRRATGAGA
jgi:hypothetical protein